MRRRDASVARALGKSVLVVLVALVLCAALDWTFVHDPSAEHFMAGDDRIFITMENADEILTDLIERNEVTWDPSNGVRIEKVLAHLKRSEKPKLLLVGSSQFLVVRDDRSLAGVSKRVDTALGNMLGGRYDVYNLSLGGMTLAEKQRVLASAARLEELDHIIVGMTLWDSVSSQVRPGVFDLSTSQELDWARLAQAGSWLNPGTLNDRANAWFRSTLKRHVTFFRHRDAIQDWLEGVARDLFSPSAARAAAPGAENTGRAAPPDPIPVQYEYDAETQEAILRRVRTFLASLGAPGIRSRHPILIVLTPFRQDRRWPAYLPQRFFERYRALVGTECVDHDLRLLDASSLLDRSHFGVYQDGSDKGKIDALHFDAAGHRMLAEAIRDAALSPRP